MGMNIARRENRHDFSSWHRVMGQFTACFLMAACWCFCRFPHANFLIVTFCVLSASILYNIPSGKKRFSLLLRMSLAAASLQFLIGICREEKILLLFLPSLASAAIFHALPSRGASCGMCIAGFLAFFAPGGYLPAVDRALEIALGIPMILAGSAVFHSSEPEPDGFYKTFDAKESGLLALMLGIGIWIAEALKMQQGAWIMLTFLFIVQFAYANGEYRRASRERIIAAPIGILLGGIFMGCLTYFDYRLIILLIIPAALGFYLLYQKKSFFLFTVFFMMTITVYADWQTGESCRFHFCELLFWRTAATMTGAGITLLFQRSMKKGEQKT